MKSLHRVWPALAGLLILPAAVHAQTKYRFEVFGGATFPREKTFEITVPQSTVPMRGRQEFSAGGRAGVRLGADGRGHWGMDIDYSYGANATRIINETNNARFGFSTRTHHVNGNALWYPGGLTKKSVFPFLTVGVGGTLNNLSQATINAALDPGRAGLGKLQNDNIFAFNAGGGVRFKINDIYGFRFDVRDYMSRAVRYGLPKSSTDPNATVFPIAGLFHQLEVTVSFVYYFR
jgi:hypothetical protein